MILFEGHGLRAGLGAQQRASRFCLTRERGNTAKSIMIDTCGRVSWSKNTEIIPKGWFLAALNGSHVR